MQVQYQDTSMDVELKQDLQRTLARGALYIFPSVASMLRAWRFKKGFSVF